MCSAVVDVGRSAVVPLGILIASTVLTSIDTAGDHVLIPMLSALNVMALNIPSTCNNDSTAGYSVPIPICVVEILSIEGVPSPSSIHRVAASTPVLLLLTCNKSL